MIQIGSEGGILPNPVVIPNRPIGYDYNRRNIVVLNTLYRALMLGPAERADVIVDFRNIKPGSILILYNDAPGPYPMGDSRNDYYPGNPKTPSSIPGYGTNTRTLLQIVVKPLGSLTGSKVPDPAISLPASFQLDPVPLVNQVLGVPTPIPAFPHFHKPKMGEGDAPLLP